MSAATFSFAGISAATFSFAGVSAATFSFAGVSAATFSTEADIYLWSEAGAIFLTEDGVTIAIE